MRFLIFLPIFYFIITELKPYFVNLKYINHVETNIFLDSFYEYNIKFINAIFNTAPAVIEWIMISIACIFVLSIIILAILGITIRVLNFFRNPPSRYHQ